MDPKAPKKSHQGRKSKARMQEKFARKFPYRFSWLMGTSSELLQPWELTKMSSLLREQLPLQKTLLPTRSIPVRGLGAPDFLPPSCLQPPLSPPRNLWELALLTRRFPRPAAPPPAPRSPALHHLSLGHSAPRRS
ncbi:hypothetical protein G4228_015825 [Cervus hanglu yarkandensis]|uniref:uncharacterized protein C3orf22 homolog isoform X3 n=1 Tax=Cervus canadensis TaxID=1574408 RepID=UPI001CA355A8|nr:uncharacterized protein C3orf22 homolog isoform X3 [Cervus canadensis]XP_043741574.1 uncharacterized protein C3orf22 homolog isoform X3 [Cervus elaphus]KAF4023771.1 hypothetical protein G4228_015825 [Cervus hanglu yarkandensis]